MVYSNLVKKFIVAFIIALLSGCIPGADNLQNTRKKKTSSTEEEPAIIEEVKGCEQDQVYDTLQLSCQDACSDTTEKATTNDSNDIPKINDFLDQDLQGLLSITEELDLELREFFKNSRHVCILVERPTGLISINKSFCSCKDGNPDIAGECVQFCQGKPNNADAILYGEVTLDPKLQEDDKLFNLHNWCNTTINDGRSAPSCRLNARSESDERNLLVTTFPNSNRFEVNIGTLVKNKTYVFKLIESGSGSMAETRSKQLLRIDFDDSGSDFSLTPLQIQAVNQYDCFVTPLSVDSNGDLSTLDLLLFGHFYYSNSDSPVPLPPSSELVFCHDIENYPRDDSALYERLNLVPGHFAVWDKTDIRFFDTDQNSKRDIQDILEQKILEEYGINFQFANPPFQPMPLPFIPQVDDNNSDVIQNNTGFYMQAFTSNEGITFCPTREHYNSNDPVFRVMKEVIGVDTEAIYFALREPQVFTDPDSGDEQVLTPFMVIRESQLKKIWFYFENGQIFQHNDDTSTKKPIYFHWPPDEVHPYTKKSTQSLYTIMTAQEAFSGGQLFDDGSTIQTQIQAKDKRAGCVPKIDNN